MVNKIITIRTVIIISRDFGELLNEMLEAGEAEKHAEQAQFAEFKQFSDDAAAERKRMIEEEKEHLHIFSSLHLQHTLHLYILTVLQQKLDIFTFAFSIF